MTSFYPGPSRVYPKIPTYVREAYNGGILSINHRSEPFMELARETVMLMKAKLNIPEGYSIFFTSSATECWEIIAQSLIESKSFHAYNGAFGEKWFNRTQMLHPEAEGMEFNSEELLTVEDFNIHNECELIALTHNETSNGTQLQENLFADLRLKYPDKMIAVDATSSFGGINLPIDQADVWYASVQKCLGLPAGMAVLICSPEAIVRAKKIKEANHYNSLTRIIQNMDKWQTTHTPNVMGIFLLNRVLNDRPHINSVTKKTEKRYQKWEKMIESKKDFKFLINNRSVRSATVIAVEASPQTVERIKMRSLKRGYLLGNGYGKLKTSTFRIANFPALKTSEVRGLIKFLNDNYS